ncbi:MAG: hypothetical protein Q8N88_05560 [Nanoarchaeota archaeon]|nr:hypothetical protein [Nanoarchaeota archaeon]
MEFIDNKTIKLDKISNNLDRFVLSFVKILEKYTDYVIISGYVSILLGRTRITEDIDVFIKKISLDRFSEFYKEAKKQDFECINAEKVEEIFSYLKDGLAVRFSRKDTAIPNFEIKFPKDELDEEIFNDFIIVRLKEGKLKISSLERQIAFKKYYLKTDKDIEDAEHIEKTFEGKIDYRKINKLKEIIGKIKENEKRRE